MEFINNSKHYVRTYAYSGFPHTEANRVAAFGDLGPGGQASRQVDPGDYYVVISTTNIGPIPPGLTIAASGGVPSESTVTLTESDRFSIR
jgi:hypothetical protein